MLVYVYVYKNLTTLEHIYTNTHTHTHTHTHTNSLCSGQQTVLLLGNNQVGHISKPVQPSLQLAELN